MIDYHNLAQGYVVAGPVTTALAPSSACPPRVADLWRRERTPGASVCGAAAEVSDQQRLFVDDGRLFLHGAVPERIRIARQFDPLLVVNASIMVLLPH